MTTIYTEGVYRGEAIVKSEEHSFDAITVLSGQNLAANTVVGRVTKGIGRVSIPTVVGTGDGTASLVTAGPEAELGSYVLTCTAIAAHGGVFSLVSPSGLVLPSLTLAGGTGATTAYTSRHLNFSVTDGAIDFAVGDVFTFIVSTTAPTVIGGTGTGTISVLSLGPDAKPGNYRVINIEAITNGGRFQVLSPDGDSIGEFLMSAGSGTATAFATRQINFTLTDATDFILGNYFDVAVFNQLAGGKVVAFDPTPTSFDGRHTAVGVLLGAVDATSADTAGVILARRGVVNEGELVWLTGLSTQEKASGKRDLAACDIVVAASV